MDLGLRDRVVLVTGSGGGAGPTIGRAFAAEGAMVASITAETVSLTGGEQR